MSQEQPRRPREKQQEQEDPIRYGDLFEVSGELASKPVAPHDAELMETAEKTVFGETQLGGTATVMRAAANLNVRDGLLDREINDDPTKVSVAQGVSVTRTDVPGRRIFSESVDGQVLRFPTSGLILLLNPKQFHSGLRSLLRFAVHFF